MGLNSAELARRLRQARDRLGLTQTDIAQRLGVDYVQYQRWETGKVTPRAGRLPAIAEALEIELDELQGPAPEETYARLERKVDENAQMIRQQLALSADLRDLIRSATDAINRLEAGNAGLLSEQRDFLQALGVDVPPPPTDAPGRARKSAPKPSRRSRRAT